jgi:GT2 family glycosyltransferase
VPAHRRLASAPRTSVIVLNFNGARWLSRCLDALLAQGDTFEVLVVDNASTDGSAERASERPGVQLLRLPTNVGFAGGNNAGASVARATDYLVFLNNDTEVRPGWLTALVLALDTHPEAGLATSHIVRLEDPSVVDSAGDGYLRAGGAFKRWHGQRRPPGHAVEEVFGACGAAFAIRRSLFESLGGFDDAFFMLYEDVDLSYRARLAGSRCVYVPAAVVRHAGGASLGRHSAQAAYYGQRNLEWVWVKNTPARLLWRDGLAHAVYSLAGVAYHAAGGRTIPCLRGKLAALMGLPGMWRRRRSSTVSAASLAQHMHRSWWRVRLAELRTGHLQGT